MARKNAIAAFQALLAGKDKAGTTISVIDGMIFSYNEPLATFAPESDRKALLLATRDSASRWSITTQTQANGIAALAREHGLQVIEGDPRLNWNTGR